MPRRTATWRDRIADRYEASFTGNQLRTCSCTCRNAYLAMRELVQEPARLDLGDFNHEVAITST